MNGKRMTRSRGDRLIAGVAGGLAAYFGIDPLFVRIGFVILSLFNGMGVILYMVLWLIVPNEDSLREGRETVQEAMAEMRALVENLIARLRGVVQR
ncbi:MAG: PspC domain-containing protein [Chloroflexaceae bacterium]